MNIFSSAIFTLFLAVSFSANEVVAQIYQKSDKELEQEKAEKEQARLDRKNEEAKRSCEKAKEEHAKAKKDYPCKTTSEIAKCEDKINSCVESSSQAFGAEGGDDALSGLFDTTLQIFGANSNSANSATNFQVDRSCYNKELKVTNKDIQDSKRRQQERIRELKKDIEKEMSEQAKEKADVAKETSEVEAEEQKLNADFKKFIRSMDVKKRERSTEINQDIQKHSASIRRLNSEITRDHHAVERLKFEHQKSMIQYTEDKINKQCKAALETAKNCFIRSSKGLAPAGKDDTCANFIFTGKGAKGTAQLKERLLDVRTACFEQFNQTVSGMKYDYNDKLRSAEMSIKDKQAQIKDAETALDQRQKDFESIEKEAQTELSDEQQSVSAQIENLKKKLQALITSSNERIANSKSIIEDKQKELNELMAGKLADDLGMGGSSIYDDIASTAQTNLTAYFDAATEVNSACCGELKSSNVNLCKQVDTATKAATKRSTRRSTVKDQK